MVIDNSGFLVMHPSFVESKGLYFEDRLFHITNLVGSCLSNTHLFIKTNVFKKKKYSDIHQLRYSIFFVNEFMGVDTYVIISLTRL